jgi:DNA-nicking Smr family endonuclease
MLKKDDHSFWVEINKNTKALKNKYKQVPLESSSQLPKINTFNTQMDYDFGKSKKKYNVEFLNSRKTLRKIRTDAFIDLHGYSYVQAQDLVKNFLYKNYLLGLTWVKIITGKSGILSREMPQFLHECSDFVSGYTYARPNDGGIGAIYVRIRVSKQN